MTFRDNPPAVERVLAAARRLYPTHALYLTFSPGSDGPAWEFHPLKRWLVLRTEEPELILEAVSCSLLARHAWLGEGPSTLVPAHLHQRYLSALGALRAALKSAPEADEVQS
jgi:hypothetical protein